MLAALILSLLARFSGDAFGTRKVISLSRRLTAAAGPGRCWRLGLAPLAICLFWLPALASAFSLDESAICDRAAILAASQTGVPISVLKAISLTETGRDRGGVTRPWPWTVNMEGKGVWFETEDAAQAYVDEHFKRGARSFDVGCFQINYKWHHEHFASIDAMFDPAENALYAARFLLELHAETGDWEAAAGAYHSRTPEYAERYKARFRQHRAGLAHEDDQPLRTVAIETADQLPDAVPARPARVNSFPLLQSATGAKGLGSLVPLAPAAGNRSLFDTAEAG